MIERLLDSGIRPILLTPTPDTSGFEDDNSEQWTLLHEHADQIRALAGEYEVALADSFSACDEYIRSGGDLTDLLSSSNHPNRKGHEIVAREILRWFYSGTV
jgi:lysophospholipase L1-like esterase